MNKNTRDILIAHAMEIRYMVEAWDQQVYSDHSLCGWCAIASAELFRHLQAHGIESEIHMWIHHKRPDAHVYLVVEDHIVDITATQFQEFEYQPVVVMHQREAESYTFYQTVKTFKSVPDLITEQKKNRWPAEQVAYAVQGEPNRPSPKLFQDGIFY